MTNISDENEEVAHGIKKALERFNAALPDLLRSSNQGKWVAFSGRDGESNEPLCIGITETSLYKQCIGRGYKDDEFIVRSIEPHIEEGMEWRGRSNGGGGASR